MHDLRKEINTALYVLDMLGEIDFHKLFKILYFAEQKHLVNYGSTIIEDTFLAMDHGPVPSKLYDILKAVKGESIFESDKFDKYFKVCGHKLINKLKPELEYLSASEIECINESIEENKNLSFSRLKSKSHGFAYKQADRNDKISALLFLLSLCFCCPARIRT